ncbi:MAG: 2-C-methyl-D-erythritol 2,4-cyclodiphosphate synthase [Spirochaetales bacterium]|nr:2-C-methyl-D-erythritol 2,4-cyclodiphosphate synthase [Spirochaetales bacterium]
MRIGFGYDIHRLVKDRSLILGGVTVPHTMGEEGYSDGDVLIHAVIDALLGASGLEDIGTHFPPHNKEFKDISSIVLLQRTLVMVKTKGYDVHNLDCTIILQEPHLAPYKEKIIASLAEILCIDKNSVSVKAKTKERIGETGAGKAVESYAVVLLEPVKKP